MKDKLKIILTSLLPVIGAIFICWLAFWAGYGWEAHNSYNKRMEEFKNDTLAIKYLDTNKTDTVKWKI